MGDGLDVLGFRKIISLLAFVWRILNCQSHLPTHNDFFGCVLVVVVDSGSHLAHASPELTVILPLSASQVFTLQT